VYKQDESE